jgi:hypothetical protein
MPDYLIEEDTYVNWLGQTLEVGSYVYRGARDGNSSAFKIGIITKITSEKNGKARVKWIATYGTYANPKMDSPRNRSWGAVEIKDSSGSPDLDSLVLLPQNILDNIEIHQW